MPPIVFSKAGEAVGGGGISAVWETLKNGELTSYMTDLGIPIPGWGWPYIIGAIILPTILIAGVAQAAYQYQASIQTADKAFKSFIMVPFLYIPVSIMVVLMGMCGLILYQGQFLPVDVGGEGGDPNMVLTTLIQDFLPTGVVGLLLAAILSATMSTSSTCLICSVTCLTGDVIKPLLKKKLDDRQSLRLFRACMIIVGLGTIGITLFAKDIIELITTGYAAAVAGLFVPIMATIFVKKATKPAIYTVMLTGLIVYGIIAFFPEAFAGILPPEIISAPLYLSLPLSIVLMIVLTVATQKSSHGRLDAYFTDEWEKSPGNWEKHPELVKGEGPIELPTGA
jgi:Na+/proline symporter